MVIPFVDKRLGLQDNNCESLLQRVLYLSVYAVRFPHLGALYQVYYLYLSPLPLHLQHVWPVMRASQSL